MEEAQEALKDAAVRTGGQVNPDEMRRAAQSAAARVDGEYNERQKELQQGLNIQVRGQYNKMYFSNTSRRS